MRVALIGYGKMGKAIEQLLIPEHEIVAKISASNSNELNFLNRQKVDIAFEFSVPQVALTNLEFLIQAGIPTVAGVTGWNKDLKEIETLCIQYGTKLLFSPNFSIGANILIKLNEILAEIMQNFTEYDCIVEEKHHTQKADAPSGTALKLAETIIKLLPHKTHIAYPVSYQSVRIKPDGLCITSGRVAQVVGTHTVGYHSAAESIEIQHTAHQRIIFAQGAVKAAQWLIHQPPGLYTFQNIIS